MPGATRADNCRIAADLAAPGHDHIATPKALHRGHSTRSLRLTAATKGRDTPQGALDRLSFILSFQIASQV